MSILPEPTFSIETITPAEATKLLEHVVENNRPIVDRHVQSLARDMSAGKWTLNGETIKISPQGNINDGQHRLWACITANESFKTAVVRGVEGLETIDTNRPRTLANTLHMKGHARAPKLSVALNTCWRWENTNWRSSGGTGLKPTVAEQLRFLNENFDGVNAAMRHGLRIQKTEGSLELAAVVFWRLAKVIGAPATISLFNDLAQGQWNSLNDPLFRYHEMALGAKAKQRQPHKLLKLNWLVRALDARLNGESFGSGQFLRWDAGKPLRLFTGEEATDNENTQRR